MHSLTTALVVAAALSVSGAAVAQEPASTDGKSVPMQQAPEKIKPAGKSKSAMHKKAMHHSKKKM